MKMIFIFKKREHAYLDNNKHRKSLRVPDSLLLVQQAKDVLPVSLKDRTSSFLWLLDTFLPTRIVLFGDC